MVLRESKCLFADLFEVIAVSKKKGDVRFHLNVFDQSGERTINTSSLTLKDKIMRYRPTFA